MATEKLTQEELDNLVAETTDLYPVSEKSMKEITENAKGDDNLTGALEDGKWILLYPTVKSFNGRPYDAFVWANYDDRSEIKVTSVSATYRRIYDTDTEKFGPSQNPALEPGTVYDIVRTVMQSIVYADGKWRDFTDADSKKLKADPKVGDMIKLMVNGDPYVGKLIHIMEIEEAEVAAAPARGRGRK